METIQGLLNFLFRPELLLAFSIIALALFCKYRKFCTQNKIMSALILGFPVLFFALSALQENFWIQFKRPDNVPISGMLWLVIFFTWFAMKKGVANDDRLAEGRPVYEAEPEEEEKVFVWPDLVYTEMLCLLLISILLVVWSIMIPAPLEEPANPQLTPNPSKAPWYFLGLQEILVYFDPWLAGVVIPTFIIIGLVAIPYIDPNPKGNGYYTFAERRQEIFIFLFGFLILWVLLVFQGTFLRGPNWNFYGPYEYWDVHKVVPLTNVNLSEFIWARLLGVGMPGNWFIREIFGILLLLAYFIALPVYLAKTWWKKYYTQMGLIPYVIASQLMLWMMLVPIKMYLRWTLNLKYFVAIPEFFFNI
ncbi:MAG: cytochrome C [Acidobacteriota bacterium]